MGGNGLISKLKQKKKKTQKPNFHFFFRKTQKCNISIQISISLNHQKPNNDKNLLFYSISVFWNRVLIYFICLA